MEHPPLHRHAALQPLSREHFNGLRHARQLVAAADCGAEERMGAVEEFGRAWLEEISSHFDDEERLLASVVQSEDRERLLSEHEALRAAAAQCFQVVERGEAPGAQMVRHLGTMLHDHIRWEERHLFELVQRMASEEQLRGIGEQTAHVEAVRPGSRRRGSATPLKARSGAKR
jgi:hemerythrin-like domain-containing protein